MIRKILQFILIISYLSLPLLYPFSAKAAADFEIISDLTLNYSDKSDFVEVKDEVTFIVNNEKYFLQSGLVQTFFLTDYSNDNVDKERAFKLKNLKVTNHHNSRLNFTQSPQKEGIEISVKIPEKVNSFE